MYVKEVRVENQVGLHARPATFFIQKANEFKSSIWVEKDERRVNAKSLLGVLSLGIVGGTDRMSSWRLTAWFVWLKTASPSNSFSKRKRRCAIQRRFCCMLIFTALQ